MKTSYLIIRLNAKDMYDREFLMRGFNAKRIEKVIGVIAIVGEGLLTDDSKMYHLSRVDINLLESDTQQSWARFNWSCVDDNLIDSGMRRLPTELRDRITAMRTNRIYCEVDTAIPEAFRDCHTKFVYKSRPARLTVSDEKTGTLDEFTVEEIVANLKTRIKGVTIAF
ncbi:hypothetical protein MPK70_gp252 [Erwinia phage pEa_SNUABM_33]|uniref:Uncharacterized protein n=1 Tax=Erwinia phage pEa_SNUABM_33 TaxID=2869556 RepID=A0AAE7XM22_9CAUD|nr:hypothetical protein MPK70_gp252 [Erwinia phage pEa_SNUABM_33]QZE58128.1 hypothetical protein pEaSNUABM33_00252 [Erwinia phage pEa_SNUABM_33]